MLKIAYFGKGIRGKYCLKYLLDNGKFVSLVIGQSETDGLIHLAKEKKIEALIPKNVNDLDFIQMLADKGINLIILSGFNKILKKDILEFPQYGVINLHGGRLPQYRGAAPINWQLLNGEKQLGFTVMFADEGIDTGEVIKELLFDVNIDTTAGEVVQKSIEWFPSALLEVVNELESSGRIKSFKQDESLAQYYTRRYPDDSLIDWGKLTDLEVHNLVRAMHGPYPKAYCFLERKKIEILKTSLLEGDYFGGAGRIQLKTDKGAIVIASNRAILIEEVQVDDQIYEAKALLKIGQRLKAN